MFEEAYVPHQTTPVRPTSDVTAKDGARSMEK